MGAEKRKLRRVSLNLPVHAQLLNQRNLPVSKSETSGRLHDFSAGGCAFFHQKEIAVGNRVQLRIELNDELRKKYQQDELTVRGVVIRSSRKPDGYLLSVRFSIDR